MFNRLKFCGTETAHDVAVYTTGPFLIPCVTKLVRNIIFVSRPVGQYLSVFSFLIAKIILSPIGIQCSCLINNVHHLPGTNMDNIKTVVRYRVHVTIHYNYSISYNVLSVFVLHCFIHYKKNLNTSITM